MALGTSCSKDSVTGPGSSGGALTLGSATTISGAVGSEKNFTVVVPAGTPGLRVSLTGSSGDADLYVRFGSAPQPGLADCSSTGLSSNEECTIPSPAAGTWHISVIAFEAYSGVQLRTEVASTVVLTSGVALTNQSGAEGSQRFFTIVVPAGASALTVTTTGGTGDVDLYTRFNAAPTAAFYDCSSEGGSNNESCVIPTPSAGVWHIMLEGWEAYTGVTLRATIS